MKLYSLKANHLTEPVGYTMERVVLSWKTEAVGEMQKAVRIIVSDTESFDSILYDSGVTNEADGIGFVLPLSLEPETRYYWKVTVQTQSGEEASNQSWFETGKMSQPWKAKWIMAPFHNSPYICKEFMADEVSNAFIQILGRGLYEVYVNGQRVGEDYLDPGYSAYDFWEQIHTFHIEPYLKIGKNVIGFMLGDGWYRGRLGYDGHYENNYGSELMVKAELHLIDRNKKETIIGTDESFLCFDSPIIESNIYDGEIFDARKEISDWCIPEGNKSRWIPVKCQEEKEIMALDRLRLPVRKHEVFIPELIISKTNEIILDFKQNMAGWVEGEVTLKEGETMTLSYGEILQDGCFYNKNLRTAKAKYSFISNGEKKAFRPYFTFYGFRYVKVCGVTDLEQIKNFRAYALYSDFEEVAEVTTSHPLVNQLISNVFWGQKGNFLDVPTDCPQRDERLGWTGDTQIFAATASYNVDSCAFYTKHLKDTRLEQIALDGGIPFVVPYLKTVRAGSGLRRHSSCAWGDIATVLPWTMYQFYADLGLLSDYFSMMKDWVQSIKRQDDKRGSKRLWDFGFHFADWLALDNYKDPNSPMGGTDHYYVASCWYAYSAHLTAKAAHVLGKADEAKEYEALFDEIKQAIQTEYFTDSGRCAIPTQTAKVLALYMDLVPQKVRSRVAEDLVKQLRDNNMKLETGFCGTPFLLPVLTEAGYVKEAYDVFLGEDIPGWLYEVKMGATTIWERWNSVMPDYSMNPRGMNSLNHYAYGAVLQWVYESVCGIKGKEEAPGFAAVKIEPNPDDRLSYARVCIDTAGGKYISEWKVTEQGIDYNIEIPFNRSADIKLPGEESFTVSSGRYSYHRQ